MRLMRHLQYLIFALLLSGAPALAGDRIALVIGNAAYTHTSKLANPGNDANVMADTLQQAGFQVTRIIDADQTQMKRALLEFGRALRGPDVEAGLFYYAGHGVQRQGENYLVPVNANILSEDEIDFEAVNVNSFLQVMNSSNAAINIVILDACRNNPFASSARSASRGLAPVDAPKGTLIAYATSPGDVALDGSQGNSPYTLALSSAIANGGGQTIESIFKTARRQVLAATNSQQIPWETSSITGDFFFHRAAASPRVEATPAPAPQPTAQPQKQNPEEAIARKYELTLQINSPGAWRAFLKAHQDQPDNFYVALAQDALARLEQPQPQPQPKQQRHLTLPQMPLQACYYRNFGTGGSELCVSSVLPPQAGNSYAGDNLADGRQSTAWIEADSGDGIGEVLRFDFEEPVEIDRVQISNGYNKSARIYSRNSRVRRLRVQTSTGMDTDVRLYDRGGFQTLDLPPLGAVRWITLTIQDIYPGSRYRDTAISEIRFR